MADKNIDRAVKTTEAQAQAQLTPEKIEDWVQSVKRDADIARTKTADVVKDAAQQKSGEKVPFIVDDDDAGSGINPLGNGASNNKS